jgi:hypothetical protein
LNFEFVSHSFVEGCVGQVGTIGVDTLPKKLSFYLLQDFFLPSLPFFPRQFFPKDLPNVVKRRIVGKLFTRLVPFHLSQLKVSLRDQPLASRFQTTVLVAQVD